MKLPQTTSSKWPAELETWASFPMKVYLFYTHTPIANEHYLYSVIKNLCVSIQAEACKVDTVQQAGFPDQLVLRKGDYMLIESKVHTCIPKAYSSLHWQTGQQGFAGNAFLRGFPYYLALGIKQTKQLYFITVENRNESSLDADFVGRFQLVSKRTVILER